MPLSPWVGELAARALRALDRESIAAQERRLALDPVDCPVCGSVLQINADGRRNCPMGDFRWER